MTGLRFKLAFEALELRDVPSVAGGVELVDGAVIVDGATVATVAGDTVTMDGVNYTFSSADALAAAAR